MNARFSRPAPTRAPVAPVHRGPGAMAHVAGLPTHHAPNAALLIDFDNVTMGIGIGLAIGIALSLINGNNEHGKEQK